MYFLWEETLNERDGEIMKFIVYNSDYYYPYDEVFNSLPEAIAAFAKLKEQRKGEVESENDAYFETDYLCIVLDEIDKEKMKLENAPFVPDED